MNGVGADAADTSPDAALTGRTAADTNTIAIVART